MIQLDGIIILASVEQIIEDLRMELIANEIPLLHDVKYRDTTKDVMVTCPHHANGQEHSPSCGISRRDVTRAGKFYPAGTAHCFTCGFTADLFEFVSRCWGTNDRNYGKRYVVQKYNSMGLEQRPDIKLNFGRERKVAPKYRYLDEKELDPYRFTSTYLYERGFNDTTIEFYEYGYDDSHKAITLPIRDHKGGLVFIKKRLLFPPPGGNKYLNAADIPKQYIIYGFYHMLKLIEAINNGTCANKKLEENYKRLGLILTEGEFNASYLVQNGYPAVSLLGRILFSNKQFPMQRELLQKYGIRRLTPWMDFDEHGQQSQQSLIKDLYKDFLLQQPDYTQFYTINDDGEEVYLNDANNYTPDQLDNLNFINAF